MHGRPSASARKVTGAKMTTPCRHLCELPRPAQLFLMLSSPLTTPAFWLGCEAFCLGGFSALGLRTSLFDFFWLLAMTDPLGRRAEKPVGRVYAIPRSNALIFATYCLP